MTSGDGDPSYLHVCVGGAGAGGGEGGAGRQGDVVLVVGGRGGGGVQHHQLLRPGEWLGEGRGGGGGVGGERLRQLDGALYAGRQEGDPGRSWSWYRWSYLEQYLHVDAISAMS